jgi:hypothetical protein
MSNSTAQDLSAEAYNCLSSQQILKDSFSCSTEPATTPYPEPDESRSHPSQPVTLRYILILSCLNCLDLSRGLFVSGFPSNFCVQFSSTPRPFYSP